RKQRDDLVGACKAEVNAPMGRQAADFGTEQLDRPRVARKIAGQQIEERGLARTVGADDQAPLARRHGERDIGDRRQAAEGLLQVLETKRFHSLWNPGTTPSGMKTTIRTKTKPSSMFQRSM